MFRIKKQKCVGCRTCVNNCPGAIRTGSDGKAEIIDQEKLEKCGGESVCLVGAIEEISEEVDKKNVEQPKTPLSSAPAPFPYRSPPAVERGLGMGGGRGMNAGRGRGFGGGPRDGRGGGRGGGGRGR